MADKCVGRVAVVVAVASATGRYGGPFDIAARQAEILEGEGYAVRVVAGSFAGDRPEHIARLDTVTVRHVFGLASFSDVFSLRAFRLLWRSLRAADTVHVAYAREMFPLAAVALARLMRRRLILQPHGMLTSRQSRVHATIDAVIVKPLIGPRARVIALTLREKDQLERWSPALRQRIHVVGNPPPSLVPEELGGADAGEVLFAARLHPRKRVLDFAQAAQHAAEEGWRDRYVVLGPDEGDLDELLRKEAQVPNLKYEGSTDSVGVLDRLKRCASFVLCSDNEPWGNVLVSALVMGKPVVVTESSALAGWVREYRAGVVVPDRSPEMLARAVHALLDADLYSDLSKGALRLADEQLASAATEAALLGVYRALSPGSNVT